MVQCSIPRRDGGLKYIFLFSQSNLIFFLFSSGTNGYELESVKKLVESSMGNKDGADIVIRVLEKMSGEISALKQICWNQGRLLRGSGATEPKVCIFNKTSEFVTCGIAG